MRLTIKHETDYAFDAEALHSIQYLRLTPRKEVSQKVLDWTVTTPGHLTPWVDGFGNVCHVSVQDGPHTSLRVVAEGEVETEDTGGVLPVDPRMSPRIFLRQTPYTITDSTVADFASPLHDVIARKGILEGMHALMDLIRAVVPYESGITEVSSTASEVLTHGKGVCQDHAHLFIACCRLVDVPARYVSGYLWADGDGANGNLASHAWAEALVDGLGWVSFDPSNGVSATSSYVRLAVGFDYASASPISGLRRGGGGESLEVHVQVGQVQSQ